MNYIKIKRKEWCFMSTIQPKHMINKVIDTAAKNKNTVTLNLNEIERTVAKKVAQKTQFEAGVNAVKEATGELAVPSAGTLRAYAGIDTPIKTYSKNFPKH